MRKKIEIFNENAESLAPALGITPERMEIITNIVEKLMEIHPMERVSQMFELLWNNQKLSDVEVLYCIFIVGRIQGKMGI